MSSHASEVKPCVRCGKERVVRYDRRNYCISCRDETIRPIADWMVHGACNDPNFNPDWWWPESSDPATGQTPVALAICGHCKVRDLCLDYAMQHKERYGIWGGLMSADRLRLMAEQDQAKKAAS